MGVKGLWRLLLPTGRRVSLDSVSYETLAIDASIWLVQFIKANRDPVTGKVTAAAHIIGFFRRICRLLYYNIRPIFVFDGVAPEIKRRELRQRAQSRQEFLTVSDTTIQRTARKLIHERLLLRQPPPTTTATITATTKSPPSTTTQQQQQTKSPSHSGTVSHNDTLTALVPGFRPGGSSTVVSSMEKSTASEAVLEILNENDDDMNEDDEDGTKTTPSDWDLPLAVAELEDDHETDLDRATHAPTDLVKKEEEDDDSVGVVEYEDYMPHMSSELLLDQPNHGRTSRKRRGRHRDGVHYYNGANHDISHLSPMDRKDAMEEIQRRQRLDSRREFIPAADNMIQFSQVQIKHFLKSCSVKRQMIHLVQQQANYDGSGNVMASDNTTRLELIHEDAAPPKRKSHTGNSSCSSGTNFIQDNYRTGNDPDRSNNEYQYYHPTTTTRRKKRKNDPTTEAIRSLFQSRDNVTTSSPHDHDNDQTSSSATTTTTTTTTTFARKQIHPDTTNAWDEDNDDDDMVVDPSQPDEQQALWNDAVDRNHFTKRESPVLSTTHATNTTITTVPAIRTARATTSPPPTDDTPPSHRRSRRHRLVILDDDNDSVIETTTTNAPTTNDKATNDHANPHGCTIQHEMQEDDENDDDETGGGFLLPMDQGHATMPPLRHEDDNHMTLMNDDDVDWEDGNDDADHVDGEDGDYDADNADTSNGCDKHQEADSSKDIPLQRQNVQSTISIAPVEDDKYFIDDVSEQQSLKPQVHPAEHRLQFSSDTSDALIRAQETASKLGGWAGGALRRAILEANGGTATAASTVMVDRAIDVESDHESDEDFQPAFVLQPTHVNPASEVHEKTNESKRSPTQQIVTSKPTNKDKSVSWNDINIDTEFLEQNDARWTAERNRRERDAETISDEMLLEVKQLLELFGIPYIVAPAEAESQCVALERLGMVSGIVTDDSDAFVFGGKKIYKNIFDEQMYTELYNSDDAEREMRLNQNSMVALAMLLGSDYTVGVKGVGIVNAMEILTTFDVSHDLKGGLTAFRTWLDGFDPPQTLEDKTDEDNPDKRKVALFHLKHKTARTRWIVPQNFPADNVIKAYIDPVVDKSTDRFSWGAPDIEKIIVFCSKNIGWTPDDTKRFLEPVIQSRNNKGLRQTRIDSFMRYEDGIKFADIRSKRLRDVLGLKDESFNNNEGNSVMRKKKD